MAETLPGFILQDLEALSQLPQGWHDGYGGPVAREVLDEALRLLGLVWSQGLRELPDITPDNTGATLDLFWLQKKVWLNVGTERIDACIIQPSGVIRQLSWTDHSRCDSESVTQASRSMFVADVLATPL